MPDKTNAATVKITTKWLEKMLGLPEGHRILRVLPPKEHTFKSHYEFEILVEGPQLPVVREGEMYPPASLYTVEEGKPFKVKFDRG